MRYIYHYTSVESLLGMLHEPTELELNEIRHNGNNPDYGYYLEFHASDIRLLNDKQENKLLDALHELTPKELLLAGEVANWVSGKSYVVSFCKRRDFIPMWKLYTDKENGICLKFKRNGLSESVKRINTSSFSDILLKDCTYLTEKEFNNYVKDTKRQLKEFGNKLVPGQPIPAEFRILPDFYAKSAFLKLHYFAYEQEVRIAVFSPLDYYTKLGRYGISLYYPIKIPLSFLKEIIIGPSVNQDILEYSVYELLKSKKYDKLQQYGINIKVSKTATELR